MSVKTISIRTAADGSYTYTRSFQGVIHSIALEIGDLSTPDIAITDDTYAETILSVAGVAASTKWQPTAVLDDTDGTSSAGESGPLSVMGVLKIAVTGGGATKRGKIILLYS